MNEHPLKHKMYRFENYVLDTEQKLLFCGDDVVHLGQKSYECLLLLVENAGKVVLKETFFEKIWENSFVEDAVLAVNISALRKIFGEEKEGKKYIETFSRKGYKFTLKVEVEIEEKNEQFVSYFSNHNSLVSELPSIYKSNQALNKPVSAEVKSIEKDESDENFFSENFSIHEKTGRSKFSRTYLIVLCAAAVFLIGAAFLTYRNFSSAAISKNAQAVSIAVFPLENLSGDPNLDYLSISIPDGLNYSLLPIPNTKTISTSIIKKYVGQSYNPIEEGEKLGVSTIVTGSYQVKNGKLIVNLQVTDVSKTTPIAQRQFETPMDDINGVQNTMFRFLISQLNLTKNNAL